MTARMLPGILPGMTARGTSILLSAILLLLLFRGGSGPGASPLLFADDAARGSAVSGRVSPGRSVSIRVRPSTLYRGAVVHLAAEVSPAPPEDASYAWSLRSGSFPPPAPPEGAAAGLFLFDDLREVEWRAPAADGPCRIAVTVSFEGEVLHGEAELEVRRPSTADMVWIPPGSFLRGDTQGTANPDEAKTIQNSADEPCHEVYLDGFWIDRFPVTHQAYAEFLREAVSQGMARVEEIGVMGEFEGGWVPFYYFQSFERLIPRYRETRNARKPRFLHWISPDGSGFRVKEGKEKHPIVDVSWFGAAAYARFHGKSLPTEAQWEKAARGGDGRRFPWGRNLPTPYHANVNNAYGELAPVGAFSPLGDSPFGVADMLSNCVEWTNDWFNPRYYEDYRGEAPLRNPRGPFWGRSHAIRGSPASLQYPRLDDVEPVSFRYTWIFEFLAGDIVADRSTTFRTALAGDRGPDAE